MTRSRSILVVDDNKGVLTSLQYLLGDRFAHVICLSSPQGILPLLERQPVDVVLLDMNFSAGLNSGGEGLFYLQEIKVRHPHLPVVLFTAFADISLAVEGLKRGAADFVVKPYDNARLLQTLEEACATKSGTRPKRNARTADGTEMFWGTTDAMQRLRTQVQIYARMQKEALRKQITLLDAYSPLAILQRGYALVEQQDTLIKSARQLQKGDQVHIRFHDGGWRAQLIEKEKSHGKEGNI